jgi:hypothetical protein
MIFANFNPLPLFILIPRCLQANAAADSLRAQLMAKCSLADELTAQLMTSRRAVSSALEQVPRIPFLIFVITWTAYAAATGQIP